MLNSKKEKNEPLVSVLVSTFNRRVYLYQALSSILNQNYSNLQVIVVNDGGEDVSEVVESFNDDRLVFINRKENYGKAFSLNQALSCAEGKYIAYLDDDDIYYPEHIGTLVEALETHPDYQAAYSDFYKVYCKVAPDKSRKVLSKVVEVSRDFDRFFILYFNHVLHVCLMHRRDLIQKTGLYNENLNVLIDWDMTRRLAFFTDFYHVCRITGEYYQPMGECDRISVQRRKDKNEYLKNVLAIRATRPDKPWLKIDDLSIILVADSPDSDLHGITDLIRWHCFYPYTPILPLYECGSELCSIGDGHGTEVFYARQVDSAIKKCSGRYVAVVPEAFLVKEFQLENSLYALMQKQSQKAGYVLEDSTEHLWSLVVEKDCLECARRKFPNLAIRKSLVSDGITLKKPINEELPLKFDKLLGLAFSAEKEGNWLQAADLYNFIAESCQNELWMKRLAAKALYNAGRHDIAAELCHDINLQQPAVETLLLEGKIQRRKNNITSAIELLSRAKRTLERQELLWV